jgi:hypothetical protein
MTLQSRGTTHPLTQNIESPSIRVHHHDDVCTMFNEVDSDHPVVTANIQDALPARPLHREVSSQLEFVAQLVAAIVLTVTVALPGGLVTVATKAHGLLAQTLRERPSCS